MSSRRLYLEEFNTKRVRRRLDSPLVYEESAGNKYMRKGIQSVRNDYLYTRWATVKGSGQWTVQTVGHPYKSIHGLTVSSTNASRPSYEQVVAAVKAAGGVPRTQLSTAEELSADYKQRKAVKLAKAEERRAASGNANKTLAKSEASGKGKKADAERPTAADPARGSAPPPRSDAHAYRGGCDAELSEEEDEVPVGSIGNVVVNPSEEPVDPARSPWNEMTICIPGKPMFKPVPLFEGVVLANSPVDTVKHGQCEMPLSEDHLSLVVKQWHWTVTHKDTVMAHVKKVLMAIFKPIEKLGGKNIKDADRMGKMLAEKILCGQCPSGINLV
eukprot:gene27315-33647_t